MGKVRTSGRAGKIADVALWATLIAAPLLGGSASLHALPPLAVLVTSTLIFTLLACKHAGRSVHVQAWLLALGAFTLIGLIQVLPVPSALLGLFSPRAFELREFIAPGISVAPVSYEPSESLRASLELLLCAMLGLAAYERVRARKNVEFVAMPLAVAAVASVAVASIHVVLRRPDLFGMIELFRPAYELSTTFVNENHASGFMVLAGMSALGLALSDKSGHQRLVLGAAAALCVVLIVVLQSRGGIVATSVALLVFAGLRYREQKALAASMAAKRPGGPRRHRDRTKAPAVLLPVVAASVAGALIIGATWFHQDLAAMLVDRRDPLAIQAKVAAMQDAWPLILDHWWTGIGRGAYVSVYPGYKTSAIQLTFSHPENLVVQLLAEWGLVAGGLALAGLVVALAVRLGRSKGPVAQAMMCGVAGVVLQNLVDFSLELPGVALCVAAVLGATSVETVRTWRLSVRRVAVLAPLVAAPALLVLIILSAAYATPDLPEDLRTLETAITERVDAIEQADSDLPPFGPELEAHTELASRHPANHVIAARLSYLAEIGDPLDIKEALRWANRTLYLAPSYADGHLAAGRLLIRGGIRKQGFVALRQAWALASASRIDAFIAETVALARTPDELMLAVPRRDLLTETLHEEYVIRALRALGDSAHETWGASLVRRLGDTASIPQDKLLPAAVAAIGVGELDIGQRLAERLRDADAQGVQAALLLIKIFHRRGETDRVSDIIDEMLDRDGVDAVPFLRERINLALARGQIHLARQTFEDLELRISPTQRHQVELARTRSRIEEKDGKLAQALRAIGDAVRLSPGDADIRMTRARLLERLGRNREARLDVEMALAVAPKHRAARTMMARLRSQEHAP